MRKTEGKRRSSNCAERYLKNECFCTCLMICLICSVESFTSEDHGPCREHERPPSVSSLHRQLQSVPGPNGWCEWILANGPFQSSFNRQWWRFKMTKKFYEFSKKTDSFHNSFESLWVSSHHNGPVTRIQQELFESLEDVLKRHIPATAHAGLNGQASNLPKLPANTTRKNRISS